MAKDEGKRKGQQPPTVKSIQNEIRQALSDREFETIEEAQAVAEAAAQQVNRAPLDDFQGLSPDQMHQLFHHPFESDDLVRFGTDSRTRPPATTALLLELLAEAIGEKGIKLTPKGNLPRKLVAAAVEAIDAAGLEREWRPGSIRNEEDLDELHTIKLVAELGRFTRKQQGRLLLTRTSQRLFAKGDWAAIYPALLYSYCREFNWAYRDGLPDLPIIQDAFAFSLYLFHLYGNEWKPITFYQDRFMAAFPAVLTEVPAEDARYWTPDEVVRQTWALRTVDRFARFFGLVERAPAPEDDHPPQPWEDTDLVRKSPLFGRTVRWQLA